MSKHSRWVVAGISFTLAAALVLGAYLRLRSAGASEEESAAAILQGAVPSTAASLRSDIAIPVSAEPAVRGTLVIRVSAAGEAEAWQRTSVTAQVAGRISELPVRENAAVAPNRTLAVLDPVEFEMQRQEALLALRNAEAIYRELTLFDDRIADPAVRDERQLLARSRSGLEAAELAVQRAELELARTRITAPIGGRVADLKVVPGQWVTPSTELMTVIDLDPIRVQVQVLEGEVGHLAPGRAARVSFAAFPGETLLGRVETINPIVESQTRTARVTVLVPNPAGRILPGMYARVAVDAREYPDRVMVPRSAILERDRRTMLFVYEADAEAGRAEWRYVTTGLENETHVEIIPAATTDSVRAGELVLTEGHYSLIHDARVRLAEPIAAGRE